MRSDTGFAAQRFVQMRDGGDMVCMNVGFQNSLHHQPLLADLGDDTIGRAYISTPGGVVEIQDLVENRTDITVWVPNHVTEGVDGFVKERLNNGCAHGLTSRNHT